MNYRIIANTLGRVLIFEAACMLLPLICAVIYGEPYIHVFLICMALCIFAGAALMLRKAKNKSMYAREGFLIVALSWIFISIFGALPFFISRTIPAFADALFETVSGFTTTGASVLSDVESLPKCMLFWRSFSHWIGGMGVLVFLVAILPLSGGSNMYLIKAESTGPSVSKLVPRVGETAKILYLIYTGFTVCEFILLLFGGMSVFDALTTAFGTAGTGGFGIKNDSIGGFSPYIQYVVAAFMIMFGVDFSVYYLILMRRFKNAFGSEEVKVYFSVMIISAAVIFFNCRGLFSSTSEGIRLSVFQVGSIMTSTGYSTADFDRWPELSKAILVTLMFIGACAGSTGGGVKVSRIVVLVKSIAKELKITAHPNSTHKITMNGRLVEHETVRAINVFIAAYIVIYVVSLLIISADGFDYATNFTAVVATLNNIGPGLAKVGPTQNFGAYSVLSKLIFSADMIIGRLEIYPVLILISPYTWKK